ncbi:hypothetical protein [Photobacterium sanguinicancri]|uniref:hypothetical protein n=1 Tax=Photobacterium sanguinicancri TaxID=875932 RepID=UPI00247FAAC2|nr:hypothetical protein [Photobacterium sanguinicancri]
MQSYNVAIESPFVTVDKYCTITGMPKGTVIDYIRKGKIIIKAKDAPREKPLINMHAMHQIAMHEAEAKVAY